MDFAAISNMLLEIFYIIIGIIIMAQNILSIFSILCTFSADSSNFFILYTFLTPLL